VDLKARLAQLDGLHRRAAGSDTRQRDKTATTSEAAACADELAPGAWADRLSLTRRETTAGPAWVRDHPRLVEVPPPVLGSDLTQLVHHPRAATSANDLLFLDTETTGLAGGTGSLAFLVGLAWWEGNGLRVRQYFLPQPGREPAILAELARLAGRFRVIVSYNGASFDWPLLRSRALLARRPDPLENLAGWDLLHAARRLWGRRLPDLKQATVEAAICAQPRAPEDIPGAHIPAAYFDFLGTGDTAGLQRVLDHNRWDMEGMARILTAMVTTAGELDPLGSAPGPSTPSWQEAWARGRIWEARRDRLRAGAWMERAVAGSGLLLPVPPTDPDALPERFLVDAVRILKRVRRRDVLRELMEQGLARLGRRPWLLREAAMLFEHRYGRPDLALAHAEKLGEARRLRRLRRKLHRSGRGCRDP
jgi:uncharacterized protein YprB with RNaseH-like and TPR domain